MPLRLLSSPITATRSAIGVVPGATWVTVCGISTTCGSGSASFPPVRSGAPRGPQAVRTASVAAAADAQRRFMAQSGVQAS
jgi:hypothetical protein